MTEVRVVVSLDELVRDFESEKDEVEPENHTDEGGKGQQCQTSVESNKVTNWRLHLWGEKHCEKCDPDGLGDRRSVPFRLLSSTTRVR